jgi:uncharacterized membrane protein
VGPGRFGLNGSRNLGLMAAKRPGSLHERPRIPSNFILVFGVLVSIGTGILFFLRTDVSSALAFVVGLQVSVLTFVVELLLRRNSQDALDTRNGRLIAAMEELDWMPGVMDSIVQSAQRVDARYPNSQIILAARSYLNRCAADLKELERGHLRVEWEDIDLVLAQTHGTTRTLRATSVDNLDLSFWNSRAGDRYWAAHEDAIARGVQISRIFVYSDWTDELNRLALKQVGGGVRIFRVPAREVPARLLNDMIVWDEACGYETQMLPNSAGLTNFYTLDGTDIQRMLEDFRVMQGLAEEYS